MEIDGVGGCSRLNGVILEDGVLQRTLERGGEADREREGAESQKEKKKTVPDLGENPEAEN